MLWYSQVVFRWRSAASTMGLLLLTVPALLMFMIISNFSLHPLKIGWMDLLLSLRTVLFVFLYLFVLSCVMIVYSYTFTVQLPIYKTRMSIVWNIMSPGHLAVIFLFMFLGGGCGYCLAELAGYHRLWETCYEEQMCLNEYLLFFSLYGIFFGLCYGTSYYYNKEYFLVFPSIQQQKMFRLKGHFTPHLWEGLMWTMKILRFYCPLYYLLGSYPRSVVTRFFGVHLRDDLQLDTIFGLFDVGLAVHLIMTGTLIHVSWSFGLRIFRTFQTEAVRFPVVATFFGESSKLLTTALSAKTPLILKYLGYLDLHQLALYSSQRRQQVFSLNQAGQPSVWNDISSHSLSLINSLTQRLSGSTEQGGVSLLGSLSTTSPTAQVDSSPLSQPWKNGSLPSHKGWSPISNEALFSSPGAARRRVYNERARLWSYSPGVEGIRSSPPPKQMPNTPGLLETVHKQFQQVVTIMKGLPQRISDRLKKKAFFSFFLSELPDAAVQKKFADGRLQVWAITGIAGLAVASYTEDSFGVVQRSLPNILETLIKLSQVMDKHVKSPLSSSKSTRNTRIALEANGRYAIKTALQTSLHSLATTFNKEKRSLHLSDEHLTYWNTFVGAT